MSVCGAAWVETDPAPPTSATRVSSTPPADIPGMSAAADSTSTTTRPPMTDQHTRDYFTPPTAITASPDLAKAYSLGIRMVAEYLRREDASGDWTDYVKADFSSAWLPEHRYSDEEQS